MSNDNFILPRTIGVLLHPTALPDSPVCGSLGAPARAWLRLLSNFGVGVWQFLPLSPTDSTGSPYSSPSSFALNPWLLDAYDLLEEGFLTSSVVDELPGASSENSSDMTVDFYLAEQRCQKLGESLRELWSLQSDSRHCEFKSWCSKQYWLEDHVLFMELRRQYHGLPWWEWPRNLSLHLKDTLARWKAVNQDKLLEQRLLQWHLARQLASLRALAADLGVVLFGDVPFYVARDSADVWSYRHLFSILPNGEMQMQSGVPPDYFSSTGQLWGTPVYRWWTHKISGFRWWRRRFARQWEQVDLLRLDHFRALVSYWAVPGNDETAQRGHWRLSPGFDLLRMLSRDLKGKLPLVAEDLGVITSEVESLRDRFSLPGMKILQFAFDGNRENPYLPENVHGSRWVVYTGTHDNSTTIGWWQALDEEVKQRVEQKLNCSVVAPGWQLLELGLATEAFLVVAPLQDLLHLGDEARFNTPGTVGANWRWRLLSFDLSLEGALKGFGERGRFWGRSMESAVSYLRD